ncbi:hypothetical protein FNV43_RR21745 [Rhamnella rubrinervis]|uniref:Uncharacterized protein n=1 Tax=Rhamnella rubrinervis TaxID=2594499 RepID=A0A8K0DP58_9ROSA|nr:hypothetical protein FNV43_RR21745 [Rhamnella rubrinervis]
MAKIEELLQSTMAQQQCNEAQEQINRILSGYESSRDFNLTNEHTHKRGRTARGQRQSRTRNRDNRTERADLARQVKRANHWYDEIPDTPFVDSITLINTPAGFSAPKFTLYDGSADPGIT